MKKGKVLVMFSGGQDTTTCLAWAIEKWGKGNVETITFDYEQDRTELKSAKKIARLAGVKNTIIYVSSLKEIKASSSRNINYRYAPNDYVKKFPSTFIPGRNGIFLFLASAYAWKNGINNIVIGVSQVDYSGYFDCKDNFIEKCQEAINFGMFGSKNGIKIYAPLMFLTKAEIVKLMEKLNHLDWYKYTYTCYNPNKKGEACGKCPACKLRIKGFKEAGYIDPIRYTIKIDWNGYKEVRTKTKFGFA